MPEDQTNKKEPAANPGYATFQIANALRTSETHEDPATRERAREKARKWAGVFEGMMAGTLTIGSRQPIKEIPAWATQEVLTGGFVTGRLLASGPLQAHEAEQLKHLPEVPGTTERQKLNGYFLTETGLKELTERLRSGCYEVAEPEEGALLVIAWLVTHGHTEGARALIDVLSPQIGALRFFPRPTERALTLSNRVYLETVGVTLERIRRIRPNRRIAAQREAIQVWMPLYDRMVALFLETVAGDPPTVQPDAQGSWVSPETNKFAVVGGWPCQRYAPDWKQRAHAVLADYERLSSTRPLCGKPTRAKDSFARLRTYLKHYAEEPRSLKGRDVGMIRLILARHITRRGGPDSQRFCEVRRRQAEQVASPDFHEIAGVVEQRLGAVPAEDGLATLDTAGQQVTAEEAQRSAVPAGTVIPPSICRKLARCLYETAETLVERGVITSGETLARVIPQVTSALRAGAFDDASLGRLYAAIYCAFRRRRSLLLLNLQSQVRLEELPWVAAIDSFRRRDLSTRELSQRAFKEVARLALWAFPHCLIPNKLLQEFRALDQASELVFYLSHLSNEQVQNFLAWAEGHLREQAAPFRVRFAPALRGLVVVHAGQSLDHPSTQAQGARRFLGWTMTGHWLLVDEESTKRSALKP